jgi:MtN3 and saliva related transmembrane protein
MFTKNTGYYERYISIMGPIGNSMFYFQAYKIFINKNAASVSFLGFLISVIALSSWLIYGMLLKNKPLIIANVFGVIGALLVLAEILIYGEHISTI